VSCVAGGTRVGPASTSTGQESTEINSGVTLARLGGSQELVSYL